MVGSSAHDSSSFRRAAAAAHRVRPKDEAYNGFTAEQVLEFASLASNEANKDDPIDSAVLRAYAKSKVRMAWGTWGADRDGQTTSGLLEETARLRCRGNTVGYIYIYINTCLPRACFDGKGGWLVVQYRGHSGSRYLPSSSLLWEVGHSAGCGWLFHVMFFRRIPEDSKPGLFSGSA